MTEFYEEILLDKNLQFASDMHVQVNQSKKNSKIELLGEFLVPIKSLVKKVYKKP